MNTKEWLDSRPEKTTIGLYPGGLPHFAYKSDGMWFLDCDFRETDVLVELAKVTGSQWIILT